MGNQQRLMNRWEAAKRVGVPKKTLDDYILHVRHGKAFGFDFARFKNQRIGLLRDFVEEERERQWRLSGNRRRISSIFPEEMDDNYTFLELLDSRR
mmetsp:Transcript_4764/g.8156  ORF Transcript_4764/g.8156 Transcript_4764/m.8156 type:complete len:96 (+) Transcript_4764:689-976(+)